MSYRANYRLIHRPTPCQHRCKKPTPSTLFQRFHPFKPGWEIRVCPDCGGSSAFDCTSVHGELPPRRDRPPQ